MEKYTTVCGVELPEVDPEKNYPLVFYKVTNDWDEFLRNNNQAKTALHEPGPFPEEFLKKIAQAACTMYTTGGIGIAANQVGFKEDWFIVDTAWTKTGVKVPRVVINPVRQYTYDKTTRLVYPLKPYHIESEKPSHEGCLSVPLGFKGTVSRSSAMSLDYTNLKGEEETWNALDLDAYAVQHELDHLDGKLFIDRISRLRRSFLDKKLAKVKKTVKHRIQNHNKQIVAQVKALNMQYVWSTKKRLDELQAELEVEPIVTTPIDEMPLDQY